MFMTFKAEDKFVIGLNVRLTRRGNQNEIDFDAVWTGQVWATTLAEAMLFNTKQEASAYIEQEGQALRNSIPK